MMSKEIENKYIATILLHALGDTIGFKNGLWEFFPNNSSYGATLEKLYEFIQLGGINDIDLSDWNVSDDTILHMAVSKSLILSNSNECDVLINETIKQFIKAYDMMTTDKEKGKNRYGGIAVEKHILLLKQGKKHTEFEYDKYGGGNGSAMRCNCIGLAYFGEEKRKQLIDYSIQSSKLTHMNSIGWLGGLSTALMTAFILEYIHINDWIPKMLKIMDSNDVKKYIDDGNKDDIRSFEQFIQAWKTYYETRFKNNKPISIKSHTNLIQRLVFYNNIFELNNMGKMGFSGYSAVIVAYDCLLDAGNSWEKLVIYSMINNFDADTIGAIAGGLYGTLYGLSNVPINNLKYIEFKDKLIKIGKLLYKKFYKNEKLTY
jgi:ADP-ribosylarginine hydrolase